MSGFGFALFFDGVLGASLCQSAQVKTRRQVGIPRTALQEVSCHFNIRLLS